MRNVDVNTIAEAVKELCIKANCEIGQDINKALINAKEEEEYEIAKDILDRIIENSNIALNDKRPICQDTGMACIFLEIGQDAHFIGGNIEEAINNGVRMGYDEGYLRKSVVSDPLERINTKDNTPALIYYNIVPGDKVKVVVAPKGFGSENMSKIAMLKPAEGIEGVKEFIVDTVREAAGNACPPMVIGVGIGGSFDKVAFLAKRALIRDINVRNNDEFYRDLEEELLKKINDLGIGPQGFGGHTTALGVNIETFPTHIASLPVAVNISCHVTRHKEIII